jgi:hypothetical protein
MAELGAEENSTDTDAPSLAPTEAPTTGSPTKAPTSSPTAEPTSYPTTYAQIAPHASEITDYTSTSNMELALTGLTAATWNVNASLALREAAAHELSVHVSRVGVTSVVETVWAPPPVCQDDDAWTAVPDEIEHNVVAGGCETFVVGGLNGDDPNGVAGLSDVSTQVRDHSLLTPLTPPFNTH